MCGQIITESDDGCGACGRRSSAGGFPCLKVGLVFDYAGLMALAGLEISWK